MKNTDLQKKEKEKRFGVEKGEDTVERGNGWRVVVVVVGTVILGEVVNC